MKNATEKQGPTTGGAKKTVITFIHALNDEDFDTARECLHDKMKFDGVMGSRDGADTYIKDMEKMKFKYDVKHVFTDGDDVCVLYDITMSKGVEIYTCGLYEVKEGKIRSLKVVFDPRPLLEKSNKN
jgi:limonene-1,2-epoxide hydrolase